MQQKRFNKTLLLIAALLMIGFSSCVTESFEPNPTEPGNQGEGKTVIFRFLSFTATRSTQETVQDGTLAYFQTGRLYFTDNAGVVVFITDIVDTPGSGQLDAAAFRRPPGSNANAHTVPPQILENVPQSAQWAYLVGNSAHTINVGANISTLLNQSLLLTDVYVNDNLQFVNNAPTVHLYGRGRLQYTGEISAADRPLFQCDINLTPTTARFELSAIEGRGRIASFTVRGIFLDHLFTAATIAGTTGNTHTNFQMPRTNPMDFGENAHGVMHWFGATGLPAPASRRIEAGTNLAWALQLFAEKDPALKTYLAPPRVHAPAPRLVLRLENIMLYPAGEIGTGTPQPWGAQTQFVTVKDFHVTDPTGGVVSGLLTNIDPGTVYHIAEITFDESHLSPVPNAEEIDVQAEITISTWNRINVLPDNESNCLVPPTGITFALSGVTDANKNSTHAVANLEGIRPAVFRDQTVVPIEHTVLGADGATVGQNIMWTIDPGSTHIATFNTTTRQINLTGTAGGLVTARASTLCGAATQNVVYTFYVANLAHNTDLVNINGISWSTRNVEESGNFAGFPANVSAQPQSGRFFQWGRNTPSWSTTDPATGISIPTWNTAAELGTHWNDGFGPCPAGFRLPTEIELNILNNTVVMADQPTYFVRLNGIDGRLFGNPNVGQIFLPAAGWRSNSNNGALSHSSTQYFYWSGTSSGTLNAVSLSGSSILSVVNSNVNRANALSVRCVSGSPLSQPTLTTSATPICKETRTLTLGAATGGVGTYTYTWQRSLDNGATIEATHGGTVSNGGLDFTTSPLTETSYFRRNVTDGVGNTHQGNWVRVETNCPGIQIGQVRWATANLESDGVFAEIGASGSFFQWGRNRAWTSINPLRYWDGTTWVDNNGTWTNGSGSSWTPDLDPCPTGFRLPTQEEAVALGGGRMVTAAQARDRGFTGATQDGRVFPAGATESSTSSTNGIFIPAAGYRDNNLSTTVSQSNGRGFYWTSTPSGTANAASFRVEIAGNQTVMSITNVVRGLGYSVRCVVE